MEQELEQDPFDPDEFVERLAWRSSRGIARKSSDDFDPMALHGAFEKTIADLKDMNIRVQKKVNKLEEECQEEEQGHWQKVSKLQRRNDTAFKHFKELDGRISSVAAKVVHLGDQLEGVNTPRTRAAEAQVLMTYLKEFLSHDLLYSQVFTDPFQLEEAADIIQKLYLIAIELPSGDEFNQAREKINDKYSQIEQTLIHQFKQAHHDGDLKQMKAMAASLSQFRGYNSCIEAFIEESQKGAFDPDVFRDIPLVCERSHALITAVFSNPEAVMSKFIHNIYHGKLQNYIAGELKDMSDLEKYLNNLDQLYTKTIKLSTELSTYKHSNDAAFLNKLTRTIFANYLTHYITIETRYQKEKMSTILERYYESLNHNKKQISSGGMNELRRDLQGLIGAKTSLNIGPAIENYGGETFLSQEVTINLLQESKMAFKRCQSLSSRPDVCTNAAQIFDILVAFLCMEHIDYALELGLQAIPMSEPKTQPEIYFFEVVGQANTFFHLFEKQFSDSLIPLVSSTPKHSECLHKKRDVMESMETKMDFGLDRTLSAMTGWVRCLLATEQKKTDFRPEEKEEMLMYSPACEKVVTYLHSQLDSIQIGLDGKNVDAALTELGYRVHRVIYDHLQQFTYNSMGAMLAICDVNEYRKCVKDFGIPVVSQLFNTLHHLCNLLVVVPENLTQACTEEQLSGLDKAVLLSFIQLRSDYKTAKLANQFK